MGGLANSPKGGVRWQMTDRIIDEMLNFDINKDSKITNDEIKTELKKSYLKDFPEQAFLSKKGYWSIDEFKKIVLKQYNDIKNKALSKSDTEPYGAGEAIQASYQWWKMWFTDSKLVVESLKNYKGPIIYHNGDFDTQTNALNEIKYFNKYKKSNWSFVVHKNKGHTLGTHPLVGPISDDSMSLLLQSFTELAP